MYFLGIGIIAMLLKYFEIGFVATLDWMWVLSPFGLAAAWWAFADWSGYTKRAAVRKENDRKKARIDKSREALGFAKKPRR
jgi:small Trp-rich protein